MTPQVKHGLLCLAAIALCVCVKVNAQVIVSVQDGDWSSPTTWLGNTVPAPGNYTQIDIQTQVIIQANSAVVIDNTILGNDLVITGTGRLIVDGVLEAQDSALINSTPGNLSFGSQAIFRANFFRASVIPLATWDINSTLEIVGLTSSPTFSNSNLGQDFGNVVYDCPNQGPFVEFAGRLRSVRGDFVIRNTNNNYLRLAEGNLNLTVGGDFIVEGLSKVWCSTAAQNSQLNVNGNFIYRSLSGSLSYFTTRGRIIVNVGKSFIVESNYRLSLSSSSESGVTELYIGGDMLLRSGGIIAASDIANSFIVFNGNTQQNYERQEAFELLGRLDFSLQQNSQLNLGSYIVSNTTGGSFTIGGTLLTGWTGAQGALDTSPDGNFNIAGDLILLSGAEIIYQGSDPQFIGNAVTDFSGIKTVINNSSGVTLLNDAQFHDLEIRAGNMDTNDFNLSLKGDLSIEEGCALLNNGTVIFNGDENQVVQTPGSSWRNITINNSGGADLSLQGPVELESLLLVSSAGSDLISNGNLTLVSSSELSNGTASIGPLPSGSSILGSVNVQRFMAGIGDRYRYISSPITAATVQSLKDAVPVTGTFADPSTGPGINSTAPSLFEYDETINQWKPFPTSGLAVNNLFEPGQGYCYFNWNNTTPTLWNVAGEINQGDIDFNLTFTDEGDELDGWNLLGNPYPSAIRWDDGGGWESNNSVSMGIAVRDNALGGFRYWDGLGVGNLPDGRIALGQSFWVRATGPNPLLTIHESAKVVTGASFYRQGNSPDYLELEVKVQGWSDKTFLRLREHASNLLDNYDIPKMANDNLSLSLMTEDSVSVAINAVKQIPCHLEIPLNVVMARATSGDMTFSINAFGAFGGSDFHLYNESTAEKIKLDGGGSSVKLPSAVKVVNGWKLIIDSPVPAAPEISAPFFVCEGDSLTIQTEPFQEGIYYTLFTDDIELNANEKGIFNIGSSYLNQGENLFTLEASSACSTLVNTEPVVITKMIVNPPEVISGQACQGEPASLFASSEYPIASHHWYETSEDSTTIHFGSDFITPPLMKSNTYFVSTVDSLGCESRRIPVVAEIVSYDSAVILLKDGELVSNYPDGNQWFFNGIEIPNETNQTLVPHEPGVYTLEVRMGPCRLNDQFEYFITEVTSESRANGIVVYPQPCSDRIFIRFRVEVNVELTDIFSSSGISVYNLCTFACDNEICEMNTTHLPKGLYIIRFSKGKDPYFVRFIKQ